MHVERVERPVPPRANAASDVFPLTRKYGHRHVDHSVVAKDLERCAVGQDPKPHPASLRGKRCAPVVARQCPFAGVVDNLHPASCEANCRGVADLELGLDIDQFAVFVRERVVAGLQRLGQGCHAVRPDAKRRDLLDRPPAEPGAFDGRVQGERAGKAHHLVERHAGRRHAAPANLHATVVGHVAEGLGRIESSPALAGQDRRFGCEPFAIKAPEHVLTAGGTQHPRRF